MEGDDRSGSDFDRVDQTDLEEAQQPPRIRCPRCGYEPNRRDRWSCTARLASGELCLESWNTFATRGVCPACTHRYLRTQCVRCGGWSLHEDWYTDEGNKLSP